MSICLRSRDQVPVASSTGTIGGVRSLNDPSRLADVSRSDGRIAQVVKGSLLLGLSYFGLMGSSSSSSSDTSRALTTFSPENDWSLIPPSHSSTDSIATSILGPKSLPIHVGPLDLRSKKSTTPHESSFSYGANSYRRQNSEDNERGTLVSNATTTQTSSTCIQGVALSALGTLITQSPWPLVSGFLNCLPGVSASPKYVLVQETPIDLPGSGSMYGPVIKMGKGFFVAPFSISGGVISLQAYTDDGTPIPSASGLVSNFPGVTGISSAQFIPVNDSAFLLTWTNSAGISGQWFSSSALNPSSDPFTIASTASGSLPSVTPLPNGNIVVLWNDCSNTLNGVYDSGGNMINNPFSFDCTKSTFPSSPSSPSVWKIWGDSFFVQWTCVTGGSFPIKEPFISMYNGNGVPLSLNHRDGYPGLLREKTVLLEAWCPSLCVSSFATIQDDDIYQLGSIGASLKETSHFRTGLGLKGENTPALSYLGKGLIAVNWQNSTGLFAQVFDLASSSAVTDVLQLSTPSISATTLPITIFFTTGLDKDKFVALWNCPLPGGPSNVCGQPFSLHALPVLTTTSSVVTYVQGQPPVPVASTISISDGSDPNALLASATVTISNNFMAGQDVLTFSTQDGISGNYNLFTGVLSLTGTASIASYQNVLRSVAYQAASSLTSFPRTIQFTLCDAQGYNSGSLSLTINIVPSTSFATSTNTPPPNPPSLRPVPAAGPSSSNTVIIAAPSAGAAAGAGLLAAGIYYWRRNRRGREEIVLADLDASLNPAHERRGEMTTDHPSSYQAENMSVDLDPAPNTVSERRDETAGDDRSPRQTETASVGIDPDPNAVSGKRDEMPMNEL